MSRVLVLVTGSIAAFKAAEMVSLLVQKGHEVETVLTRSAERFIGRATFEGLTRKPVRSDLFESGAAMAHIDLIRWCDLAIVCPASANSINKMAAGIGDDLAATLYLAHDFKKPWLIAPAMNSTMYRHPTTRRSLATLAEHGCKIIEPSSGSLACGETGVGRLPSPDSLVLRIEQEVAPVKTETSGLRTGQTPRHVLVTSGGTIEPIDPVRSIVNLSTGTTGALIADHLLASGCHVHFITSRSGQRPKSQSPLLSIDTYLTHEDLSSVLKRRLESQHHDAIIHAAAVSDYSLKTPLTRKIGSDSDELTLHLKRNSKILDRLREWSKNPKIEIVAFKLTAGDPLADKVQALSARARPDWVVANDLSSLPAWTLYRTSETAPISIRQGETREALASTLEKLIGEEIATL